MHDFSLLRQAVVDGDLTAVEERLAQAMPHLATDEERAQKGLGAAFFEALRTGNLPIIEAFHAVPLAAQRSFFASGGAVENISIARIGEARPDLRTPIMARLFDWGHWPAPEDKARVLARLLSQGTTDWQPLLQLFMARGMSLDPPRDQLGPLHFACRRGPLEMVKALVLGGASIHRPDADGNTPLMWACRARSLDIMRYLLGHGADIHAVAGVNEQGKGVLHHAAAAGNVPGIALLLAEGADLHDRDRNGDTPLHHAARSRLGASAATVRALLDAGARWDIKNHAGQVPGETGPDEDPVREDIIAILRAARQGQALDQQTHQPASRAKPRRV